MRVLQHLQAQGCWTLLQPALNTLSGILSGLAGQGFSEVRRCAEVRYRKRHGWCSNLSSHEDFKKREVAHCCLNRSQNHPYQALVDAPPRGHDEGLQLLRIKNRKTWQRPHMNKFFAHRKLRWSNRTKVYWTVEYTFIQKRFRPKPFQPSQAKGRRVGLRRVGAPNGGGPERWGPEPGKWGPRRVGCPKFRALFSFFPLFGVFSWNFGGV